MCSICGMVDFRQDFDEVLNCNILRSMGASMLHRGPDQQGTYFSSGEIFLGLQHNRLAVIDVENGLQPMSAVLNGIKYTIVYNGEIYNTAELRDEITAELFRRTGKAPEFTTSCDTEVVLYSYITWGEDCPCKLNGIFAFAVFKEQIGAARSGDAPRQSLFLARDRFGVKPLYYCWVNERRTFLFSSEIKGLLCHPAVRAQMDRYGLWQLFYLTPVTLHGTTLFKQIYEVQPAYSASIDCTYSCGDRREFPKLYSRKYWLMEAGRFSGEREDAVRVTRELIEDAVRRQLVSDVPLCVFLSGGLDSSVIAALAVKAYRESGRQLATYSFEYEGNRENFQSTLFQPQGDDEYALYLANVLGTDHTVLTAPTEMVAGLLYDAVLARDFPGQADIDSSLLYFCSQVKKLHTVAMSGECSDEIFGGYPWFYRPEMLERDFYPWIHDPKMRISLLRQEIARADEGYEFLSRMYHEFVAKCPGLSDDSPAMALSRKATWLSANYFMTNLLERKDRMSMYSAVEVRVPFADHRLIEHVYNVPWEYKFDPSEGVGEKSLLRSAVRDLLPDKILRRKKSPYPKTHHPAYEERITAMLGERLARPESVLHELLDRTKLENVLRGENVTWFGQLMSRPQLIAWLYQVDVWFDEYNIDLAL